MKICFKYRKGLKADNLAMIPLRFIVIVGIIAFVGLLISAEMFFTPASVDHCFDGERVTLSGEFKGFGKANSTKGTLVYLDDNSYIFHAFDETYMSALIGQRVTITCCYHNTSMNPYYDFMSARIQ